MDIFRPSSLAALSRVDTSVQRLANLLRRSPDLGVRHLPATEADGYFDAVAVGQELLRVLQLGVEVAHVDARGHTDLP